MIVLYLILYIVAFVCFVLAAKNHPSRFNLGWAGLAAWVLVNVLTVLVSLVD